MLAIGIWTPHAQGFHRLQSEMSTAVEVMATVLTVVMFAVNLQPCFAFERALTTGSSSIIPYIAMLLNCALWFKYGLLLGEPALMVVNLIGTLIAVYSVYLFVKFSDSAACFNLFGCAAVGDSNLY